MRKGEEKIKEIRTKREGKKKALASEILALKNYYLEKQFSKAEIIKAIAIDLDCSLQTIRNYIKW